MVAHRFINSRFHDSSAIISAAKLLRLVIGMNLPNREKAHIPSAKLYDYLLSSSHSVGKSKAKFFRGFGFNEDSARLLETGLLSIAQTEDVVNLAASPFGTKYTVDGVMMTPMDMTVNVRTVWIIEMDEDEPRFVTAHPLPK